MRRLLRGIGPIEAVIVVGGLVALALVFYADLLTEAVFERTLRVDQILPELVNRDRLLLRQTKLGLALFLGAVFAVQFVVVRRRRLELESLSRHHESVLRSAEEAIFGLDMHGRVTVANDAAAELTGHAVHELVGKRLHDLVHYKRPDGRPYPFDECPSAATLRGEGVREVVGEVFWRADGSSVPVEYSSRPIRVDGGIVGIVQVARDVSERRAVQRMKDEFVSVISHELRTPLTSIHGALGLLGGGVLGPLPDKGQRMVDIALENTERLIRLINDILDIERLESGAVTMQRRPCEAAELVSKAAAVMRPMADQAQVELVAEPVEATIWADPDRMQQVLTNLISNAVKFSPAGAAVRIGGEVGEGNVRLAVADRGRGIPASKLEAVFERFAQVDASDAREKGGTGLGLAICRRIVQQHDGRIWATSGPGEGATFFVELPLAPADAPPPGSRPAVLVCDDDAGLRDVVTTILEDRGLETIVADSGEQALELARLRRPAAIVLDLLLPGMDGWRTAEALRADPVTADIPVIVLSVLAQRDVPPVGTARAWLDKVEETDVLVEAVEQALSDTTSRQPVLVVVEDDPSLAAVLVAMFERLGMRTYQAASGSDALELCARVVPDLVILDVTLADGDGFTVVEGLRAHDDLRLVPLVVYTARDLDEEEKQRLRLGETEFFTKSRVSVEEFEERVVSLLERLVEDA